MQPDVAGGVDRGDVWSREARTRRCAAGGDLEVLANVVVITDDREPVRADGDRAVVSAQAATFKC